MHSKTLLTVGIALCLTPFSALRSQESSSTDVFHPPVRMIADGKVIDTGSKFGHSGPGLADVDADGERDLVVGDFSGGFRIYRNVGTNAEPRYGALEWMMAGGVAAKVPIY